VRQNRILLRKTSLALGLRCLAASSRKSGESAIHHIRTPCRHSKKIFYAQDARVNAFIMEKAVAIASLP
jgi:hypothetical protein